MELPVNPDAVAANALFSKEASPIAALKRRATQKPLLFAGLIFFTLASWNASAQDADKNAQPVGPTKKSAKKEAKKESAPPAKK